MRLGHDVCTLQCAQHTHHTRHLKLAHKSVLGVYNLNSENLINEKLEKRMQIYILLTEKCNLNCKMCIRGDKVSNELKLSDLLNISWIDEFATHDIVVTGGEPTLCKDFIPIVAFFAGHARSVSVCTNGTTNYYLFNQDFPQDANIQISLDGTKIVHDNIRGESFSKIWETIAILEEKNRLYSLSSVVSRRNIGNMKCLADELAKLRCLKFWNISYEMPFGYARLENILPTIEWNAFVDEMLDYVPFRMKIQKMFPFDLYDKNWEELDELFEDKKCSNCGSGRGKIYIYPNLNVFPCTCLTDFCLGNLKDMPLSQIIQTETALRFANYSVLPKSKCRKCKYLKFCNGGCIGMSYHFFKKIGIGDPRCPKLRDDI